MAERNFMKLLSARWAEGKFVCVGLDSDENRLPRHLLPEGAGRSMAQLEFNKAIVDATKDVVCAYKPNMAFYRGGNGRFALRDTIHYIVTTTDVPVILDVKQGDIGTSNDGYVAEDFDFLAADAVTLHNYLGSTAMEPFLRQREKGIFVLCKTTNPGSGQFQDINVVPWRDENGLLYATKEEASEAGIDANRLERANPMPLYLFVARIVQEQWNYNANCGLVVAATYPKHARRVRDIAPRLPFLMPGIGTQHADIEASVQASLSIDGAGIVVNSSSAILFASSGEDFAEAARSKTLETHEAILVARAA